MDLQDKSKKTRTQIEQKEGQQKEGQQKEEQQTEEQSVELKEAPSEEQTQTHGDQGQERDTAVKSVRGQVQVQQPDAEETELHDTLQSEITAQQEEARREVVRPKVVVSSEDKQPPSQEQQEQPPQTDVQIPSAELEEIRQRRDSALKHAMLRGEQKVTVTNNPPDTTATATTISTNTNTDTITTSSSSSSSSSEKDQAPIPPISGSKTGAKATVATKVSISKVAKKGKSVTSKYQKPKQPVVLPKKKKTSGDQPDTPEGRKLAYANAAAAAAGNNVNVNTNSENTHNNN